MPIFLNGEEYQDETSFEALNHPDIPDSLKTLFKMPLEGSEKPAGALKSESGTPVAPEQNSSPEAFKGLDVDWSRMNQPTGEAKMLDVGDSPLDRQIADFKVQAAKPRGPVGGTEEDMQTAINVALGAGPGTIAGVASKTAKAASGWWKGSDGKMRYEISDEGMKITRELTEGAQGKLKDFVDHPELYKAYPEIGDINFAVAPKSYPDLGGFSQKTRTLVVNPGKIGGEQHLLDVMVHEIQHAIQGIEGFATGSNPNRALQQALDSLANKIYETKNIKDKLDWQDLYFEIRNNAKRFSEYMYLRTPGEVEANLVASRRQLTPEQRKLMSVDAMNKAFEGERSNLHGGPYVPEFNYP